MLCAVTCPQRAPTIIIIIIVVTSFQRYLSNLQFLIDQEGERADLEFGWTSPLSGRAGRMFILPGLLKERGMVR